MRLIFKGGGGRNDNTVHTCIPVYQYLEPYSANSVVPLFVLFAAPRYSGKDSRVEIPKKVESLKAPFKDPWKADWLGLFVFMSTLSELGYCFST